MEAKLESVGIIKDKRAAQRKIDSIVAKWDPLIKFEDGTPLIPRTASHSITHHRDNITLHYVATWQHHTAPHARTCTLITLMTLITLLN
jgi:hypothetical protein